MVWQWPAAGLEALRSAMHAGDLLKEVTVIFITSTIVWSQVKQQVGNTALPAHQQKIGLKIYWAWSCPSEQDPVSSQSLPSGNVHKPLILLHQRADRMKTTITENKSLRSHGPQPCLTHRNYEPWRIRSPKSDGSWWRVLTKGGPLEKGMVNQFSILASRTPWTAWKGKKRTLKDELPRSVGARYAAGGE